MSQPNTPLLKPTLPYNALRLPFTSQALFLHTFAIIQIYTSCQPQTKSILWNKCTIILWLWPAVNKPLSNLFLLLWIKREKQMLCPKMLTMTVRQWNSHILWNAETVLVTTHSEGQENLRSSCRWSELCGIILGKDLCIERYSHIRGGGMVNQNLAK